MLRIKLKEINLTKELSNRKYEFLIHYILIKVYTKIKGNIILTILNIRIYIFIIIKLLVVALGFK